MLQYITYGDIATAESMKTTTILERLFFTSYVMMSDLKFQASRKWMIIMLTELGVRGGPSLSLSLARAVTIPVIDGLLDWCGLDAVGSLVPWLCLWAVLGLFFLCPGCGLVVWFICFPGLWGFCLVVCCYCPYMGVGFVFQV